MSGALAAQALVSALSAAALAISARRESMRLIGVSCSLCQQNCAQQHAKQGLPWRQARARR
jgi:hypothetical protein